MPQDRLANFVFSLDFSVDSGFAHLSQALKANKCEAAFYEYSRAVQVGDLPNCTLDLCDFVKAAEQGQTRIGTHLHLFAKPT